MQNALYLGKRFRVLNILEKAIRECFAIEVDTSPPAARVILILECKRLWQGVPKQLRLDNGSELTSACWTAWCQQHHIELIYIKPGKPNQNAYIQRFNKTFRCEVLNAHLFTSLQQVHDIAWDWMIEYNERRPHDPLKAMTPAVFRDKIFTENSSLAMWP